MNAGAYRTLDRAPTRYVDGALVEGGLFPNERSSVTPTKTAPPEQEAAFDAGAYDDPRLRLDYVDGKRVDRISIRFAGTVDLDRTNPDHVDLYRRLTLGKEVDFADMPPLGGRVSNKPNRQVRDKEGYVGDVAQTAVITITDIGGFGQTAADPDPEPDAE
jgi:hypothetical protein